MTLGFKHVMVRYMIFKGDEIMKNPLGETQKLKPLERPEHPCSIGLVAVSKKALVGLKLHVMGLWVKLGYVGASPLGDS